MDKALIHTYMVIDDQKKLDELSQTFADAVSAGSLKLVELVQFLGEYLTEDNADVRGKGNILP